ncbi:MAG TPA: antitoxin [Acidobacteria bacterium]|nr:antitoxin [Acidobacteriota bacterium]
MEDWTERIVVDSKILVGKPVVKGTRISVELIIDLLARGYSREQILDQYDHLTVADVQACLAYASETLRSERVYALPR